MAEQRGLTTQDTATVGMVLNPVVVLDNAREAARSLEDVISKKAKPVIMNGERYLEFEDWQTCGQFYGYTVKTGGAVLVEIDGVKGAKATADLIDIKTGMYLGGAEAYCMRDEEKWNTRPKYEWQGEGANRKRVKVGEEVVPWFQLASMAQTRAGAKALRNRLAWVVVLAGYRPTPAEEMVEGTITEITQKDAPQDKEHWCQEHNVEFFKKGKMKAYAHKLEDGSWCNEKIIKTEPTLIEPEVEEPPPDATTSDEAGVTPDEVVGAGEDMASMKFKTLREFKDACTKYFNLYGEQLDKEVAIYDLSKASQVHQAWKQIIAGYPRVTR